MAKIADLSKLFQAIAASDVPAATTHAQAMIGGLERRGQHSAARHLKGALSPNGHQRVSPAQVWTGFQLNGALSRLKTDVALADVALRPITRSALEELANEWRGRDKLRRHGLEHRSRLIFSGPPGCGKTLTARALARSLRIPCYLVRFDALIGAYLGETATHLREVFRFAERTASVLLLDEIDAIGKRRGDPMDVGELGRIVISLMQELEHSRPKGLVIAASNFATALDDALWRRFDVALEFPQPTKGELNRFLKARVRALKPAPRLSRRAVTRCRSYADVDKLLAAEYRRQIIATT
jgi:SpoVK/Ycf46/Vps4 family AAA+-type ATPase